MNGSSNHSILGLVELADSHGQGGYNSGSSLNIIRDVFHDRLKGWVRSKDQWRLLNNNRVCVILKDIELDAWFGLTDHCLTH